MEIDLQLTKSFKALEVGLKKANNGTEFAQAIMQYVQPLFRKNGDEEFGLFLIDESGEYHFDIAEEVVTTEVQTKIISQLGKFTRYKHKGSVVEILMERRLPNCN